jgi:hypothetical protein
MNIKGFRNAMRLGVFIFICLFCQSGQLSAEVFNPNTDWFKDAHYGVFMHFLPANADHLELVEKFDVQNLADQLESVGAGYLILTLGQNSGFMNSPNAAYGRITGYQPGERCSTRDLPLELYRALAPKGIRLMLYLPSQAPNQDARAQRAFGLPEGAKDQPINNEFAEKWAEVIYEWSARYGEKVAGWWFDGGYEWVGFNNEIAQIYADAVKKGNPKAIVTFNPGISLIHWTEAEDFTAGELQDPFDQVPKNRWLDGSQWHALTYIGSRWGGRDTRLPAQQWASWVAKVAVNRGVVSLDAGPNLDSAAGPIGSISSEQLEQLKAVSSEIQEKTVPDIFVSPDGNDAWSGRLSIPAPNGTDGPLATVSAAQRKVRAILQNEPERDSPIVVTLRGGIYWLDQPLEFHPEDSGTEKAPIIYQAHSNEKPILSGGRSIRGWQVDDRGYWTVKLPEVKSGDWSFSQLFVNDQRRFRPRLPDAGYYKIAQGLDPSDKAAGKGFDQFVFNDEEIRSDWRNLRDIEVIAFHFWTASRIPIDQIDTKEKTVVLQGNTTGTSQWAEFKTGHRYFLENVQEALVKHGQWYLDRPSGQLTYIPIQGEKPDTSFVIAPKLTNLLLLRGDVENRKWVKNIQFRGLTFAHSNWVTPPAGQSFPQAEINLGAAIAAVGARQIEFEDCAIRHVGEYAMGFGPGCRTNRVFGCELVDLGAGGIKIGSALPSKWGETREAATDPEALVSHHTIEETLIAHTGRLHPAGIGVWVGHSPHNTIRHNDVYDLYYSAFSLGWIWGYGPSQAHHNEVAFNHAYEIGQCVLSDMGGIYTLGISPGTTIHDNVFHDVISYDYGGWGLYTDEGSTGVEMKNNLVYRCSRGGFHQHYGKENRIENNIFAYGGEHQIQRTRTEEHTSFFFERNIVYWDNESPLLGSNWKDNNFKMDYNLYWHSGKTVQFPGGLSLKQWQNERGQELHSIVADPGFLNPSKGDFRLKSDSPAFQLGFQEFDYSKAGRRKPLQLTTGLPDVPPGFIDCESK